LSPIDWRARWHDTLAPRLPLVMSCWACGAAVLALRLLLGLAWVRRRSRPGAYPVDAAWQATLARMAGEFGIARKVVLGVVADLSGPVTAGWWRPVVLVPAALLTGMPAPLLEALLAHELAHVRRHDYLVNLLQSAIEILLFYHPAVWWLSHRIRVERELVADDLAATMLGEPRRLALALSELDLVRLSTLNLAPAAHGGNLMSRIKRLVRPEAEPAQWKLALPLLALALSAGVYAQTGTAADAPAAHPRAITHPAEHTERGEPYALVREGDHGTSMTGDSADWSTIKQLRKQINGDFLWFRDGGKPYIVRDAGVLARARAAWEPVERLGKEMDGYGREMDKHGKAMDALGKDMERAAAGMKPDETKIHAIERRMNEVGARMGDVGSRMASADDAGRARLDREMADLNRQMADLNRQMAAAAHSDSQRAAQRSMNEIGRRMNDAGKPMDALGKQMDALGKRMDAESRTADKTVRALIREAMEKGLAQPAPQA
jgi:beta-lactamase regulating signal transducer with metallopeptidase domain